MESSSIHVAHGGPVRALLAMMLAEPDALLERIGRDVGEGVAVVRPSLERHVELTGAVSLDLAAVERPTTGDDERSAATAAVLDRLRLDGSAAADDGETLEVLLDRHLSAGWVIWEAAATAEAPGSTVLAALGTALLRAGDLAAAALADGFGATDRDRVARRTAHQRGVLEELLEVGAENRSSAARLGPVAASIGLDPARPHRVTVAWLGAPLDDDDRRVSQLARALGRPSRGGHSADPLPIIAARRGRLVILDAADRGADPRLIAGLEAISPGGWWAVAGRPAAHPADLASSAADATAALEIARRLAPAARVRAISEVALERALLADPAQLRAAVDAELGVLLAAPRSGPELVETIDAYLAEGMNVTGTARRLGLAPRTVTYRLERIEELRGAPLDAAAWRRYAVLLAARDLLASGSPTIDGNPGAD
jgi:hypothetical protein